MFKIQMGGPSNRHSKMVKISLPKKKKKNLPDLGLGNDFLDMIRKTQSMI